jgi:pyrimidine operon attenuation protein/uracil phosphoribosyltransferase
LLKIICCVVISKRRKPDDDDLEQVSYCAATSLDARTLYLDKSIDLSGRELIIFDNVCTTAETIRATAQLLIKRGWQSQLKEVCL